MHNPQPGDRVKVVAFATRAPLEQSGALDNLPTLTVVRQMPHEADRFELSDGTIQPSASLYLIQRPAPADLELEVYQDNEGRMHHRDVTHLRAAPAKGK